jgi:putative thioredoxin
MSTPLDSSAPRRSGDSSAPGRSGAAVIDVTDATFETEVVQRSNEVPVVVDLWAPWCGPCKQLGPLIEDIVAATDGQVVLAKVNVDESPAVSEAFRVQSIPAVYALVDGKVVNGFVGAQGRAEVQAFVDGLLPTREQTLVETLIEVGDETALRQALEHEPDNAEAIVALAELLVVDDRSDEALELLTKIPESPETRRVAALARTGTGLDDTDIEAKLATLLDQVKDDDDARQQYVDLLELLGPDDPRTASYRKQLTARLF